MARLRISSSNSVKFKGLSKFKHRNTLLLFSKQPCCQLSPRRRWLYFCNILSELFSRRKSKGIPVRHYTALSHLHIRIQSNLGMNEKSVGWNNITLLKVMKKIISIEMTVFESHWSMNGSTLIGKKRHSLSVLLHSQMVFYTVTGDRKSVV